MKHDLREALPKVRNPPSFTLRKEKTKEAFLSEVWALRWSVLRPLKPSLGAYSI